MQEFGRLEIGNTGNLDGKKILGYGEFIRLEFGKRLMDNIMRKTRLYQVFMSCNR